MDERVKLLESLKFQNDKVESAARALSSATANPLSLLNIPPPDSDVYKARFLKHWNTYEKVRLEKTLQ